MSAPRAKVLVVEDDHAIRLGLEEKLRLEGYEVLSAKDGEEARDVLADGRPDLVVLDLMLPKLDGIEVLRWLRKFWADLPVLILSARSQESDKVEGLRTGADDYLTKPFGLSELMARIEALLRRVRGPQAPVKLGRITLDPDRRCVRRGSREITLSKTECELLLFLLRHKDRVVTREEIFDAIWGTFADRSERQVDYHVANLRKKVEEDARSPRLIVTHHGVGYQLKV